MEALPRSEISFRRSGSSGLVWDDKLLSGELKPVKPKEDNDDEEAHHHNKPEPKPYKAVEVESNIDPPSPKVSGCCALFGKPVKATNTPTHHKSKPTHHKSS